MNERIDELAAQAGLHKEWFIDNPEIEKFAKLIIIGCSTICDNDYITQGKDGDGWRLGRAIEEHFGLE